MRDALSEDLLPNTYVCPTFHALDAFFSRGAAARWNAPLARFDAHVTRHTDGAPLRVDSRTRLSGVLDTIKTCSAHGVPVPDVFTYQPHGSAPSSPSSPSSSSNPGSGTGTGTGAAEAEADGGTLLRQMERAVVAEWFSGYVAADEEKRAQVRRLGMGRFLNLVADKFESKAKAAAAAAPPPPPSSSSPSPSASASASGSASPTQSPATTGADPLRLAVYSMHDTSLAATLASLDVFEHRWPAFTAGLGFELFKQQHQPSSAPPPPSAPSASASASASPPSSSSSSSGSFSRLSKEAQPQPPSPLLTQAEVQRRAETSKSSSGSVLGRLGLSSSARADPGPTSPSHSGPASASASASSDGVAPHCELCKGFILKIFACVGSSQLTHSPFFFPPLSTFPHSTTTPHTHPAPAAHAPRRPPALRGRRPAPACVRGAGQAPGGRDDGAGASGVLHAGRIPRRDARHAPPAGDGVGRGV